MQSKVYGQKRRLKGSGDKTEETLRGKVRELEKQVEIQRRCIKTLEKQLRRRVSGVIEEELNKKQTKKDKKLAESQVEKANCCPRCSGPDFNEVPVWTPLGEVMWMICQSCQFKEKKKSDDR